MPSSLTELAISSSNDARPDETSFGRGLRLNTPLFLNRKADAWTSSWEVELRFILQFNHFISLFLTNVIDPTRRSTTTVKFAKKS